MKERTINDLTESEFLELLKENSSTNHNEQEAHAHHTTIKNI